MAPTPKTLKCPLCRESGVLKDPDDHTYTAIATARVTVKLTGKADVLDYYDTELDPGDGFRDIRCGACRTRLDDMPGTDLDPLARYPVSRHVLLKVLADINLNDRPDQVGKQAAAHSALVSAASAKGNTGLKHKTAGDPDGTYVEAQVVGAAAQLVPLLATLAQQGHSYEAQIDTEDDDVMDQVQSEAAGGIHQLHYGPVSPPPMP